MSTGKHCDLWIDQGEDWRVDVLLTGIDCVPLDLTGFSFVSEAHLIINEYTKIRIHVDVDYPETGYLRLWLTNIETSRLPVGTWHYELEMTYNENKKMKVLFGHLTVNNEVTKPCYSDYLVW